MTLGTMLGSLVSIIVAIAVVAALAFGFIYLLRIWQDRGVAAANARGAGPGMRFLRALPLGQGERIVTVEVADEVLLVGVAAHGITLLKSWPRDAVMEGERAEDDTGFPDAPAQKLADRYRAVPPLRPRR